MHGRRKRVTYLPVSGAGNRGQKDRLFALRVSEGDLRNSDGANDVGPQLVGVGSRLECPAPQHTQRTFLQTKAHLHYYVQLQQ